MKDGELLKQIRTGDLEAFRKLVERYQGRAIGFAMSLLGDYQAAEDISQEAFLRVLKSLETYQECGKFEIYFFLIIKNLCLNHLQKKREKPLLSEEISPLFVREVSSVSLEESSSLIHQALMKLREKERIAIFLKEYEQLKYSEIAEVLGITLSDVKVTIHRALKKLKKELESTWIVER